MATIKKAKAGIRMKKAEDGVSQAGIGPSSDEKERQFGKAPAKSQAGVGPSSNEKERQGDKTTSAKAPPNSFRSEAAEAAAKSSAPAKKQSFGEAFKAGRAAALKGGSKTFSYNGKSYSTRTKEDDDKDNGRSLDMAASMIKARSKQIDNKDLKNISIKPTPAEASASATKASLGQPPKKGLGFTPKKIDQNTKFKKGGKITKSVKVVSRTKKK